MNQLHPGARWLFRLNAYSRFGFIFFLLIYLFIVSSLNSSRYSFLKMFFGNSIASAFLLALLFSIILILIIGEIYSRMSYNRWFYEITHEGIKLEHGIIWKKYTSIPYERIQNVDIRRGIIARMAGFSSVEIETAGQSGWSGYHGRSRRRYHSEGYLPAIDVSGAEKIREFVMKKIKHAHKTEQGL